MSKISLKPNDSGSANFTIESPATNTNRTFTLPDEQGTVLTDVSDIEPQVKTSLNATGSAPVYACRAWVNFNGQGTVAIRESGNVSSITDNGTGEYTVNFATAMPDNNYVASVFSGNDGNTSTPRCNTTSGSFSSNSFSLRNGSTVSNSLDDAVITVAIFR